MIYRGGENIGGLVQKSVVELPGLILLSPSGLSSRQNRKSFEDRVMYEG